MESCLPPAKDVEVGGLDSHTPKTPSRNPFNRQKVLEPLKTPASTPEIRSPALDWIFHRQKKCWNPCETLPQHLKLLFRTPKRQLPQKSAGAPLKLFLSA